MTSATEHPRQVDLAHEPPFRLAGLAVTPALRQAVRDDGVSEVVEPRVMQVLVALVRADGQILSRDDLTQRCWEGRVVGEDAINRVIGRLRRLAEGLGEGRFRIETITKVGYRLIADAEEARARPAPPAPVPATASARPSRRLILGGLGGGAAALAAGGLWLARSDDDDAPPPSIAPAIAQGLIALRQVTGDGNSQALALFEQATTAEPDYARGWGLVAYVYAVESHTRSLEQAQAMRDRARAAIDRALALDPDEAYAVAATSLLLPFLGRWREREALLRRTVATEPDSDVLLNNLASLLGGTGRVREAAALLDRAVAVAPPSPSLRYNHVVALWSAGRLVEADRAMAQAFALFPRHYAVWFSRLYMLMYSGRATEALQMGEARDGWPPGQDATQIAWVLDVARALRSRDPVDAERVMASLFDWARQGTGLAENAMQFAAALGRVDEAFAVTDAYYFGRGFAVADIRFPVGQGTHSRREDRRTWPLFSPSMASLRRDPRFARLTDELGLERYWRDSGTRPDYRAG